jgi:hypothetical protein
MGKDKISAKSSAITGLLATFSKGVKPEILTMVDICRGVVAGVISDKYLGRHESHYEASLRPHVLAVAQKRGFGVFLEVPLPREDHVKKGAHKKIDYVLTYGRQAVAIECKTMRPGIRDLVKSAVGDDLKKLKRFPSLVPEDCRASGWMLIAWDNSHPRGAATEDEQYLDHISDRLNLDNWTVVTDTGIVDQNIRSVRLNQGILSSGRVGSYKAWCIAVCIAMSDR